MRYFYKAISNNFHLNIIIDMLKIMQIMGANNKIFVNQVSLSATTVVNVVGGNQTSIGKRAFD